ncbi:hypothetical protein ABT58_12480 [Photobacterium aphoticum]|uniref:DUF7674 domain-containing protein n=3 Tax=Photobacterium aphoticum TaxID=754436 RepID=A0A0J1GLX9_9GAMM|nr:hypothetical protein ABT58_12480 [Photobacterium aphoticum]
MPPLFLLHAHLRVTSTDITPKSQKRSRLHILGVVYFNYAITNTFIQENRRVMTIFRQKGHITILSMYKEFNDQFPDVSNKANHIHMAYWGEINDDAYSWFASLATALNKEMIRQPPNKTHEAIFEFFRQHYLMGDAQTKNCIDVSLVENLFWQVPQNKIEPYWTLFPGKLKCLYEAFHGSPPRT